MALSSPQPRTSGKAVPGGPIPASLPDGTARYAAPALEITAHKRGGRRAATEPARSTGQRTRQPCFAARRPRRSEEHTSELQSLMRISYAVFCLKKKSSPDTATCSIHHKTLTASSLTRLLLTHTHYI